MRLKKLIIGDVRFQFKYGFYFVYVIFTLCYIGLLQVFPLQWREKAASIMIFSDPAAMGLFFMGAIVLLEKSQRVLNSIAVSPIKVWEYILSKVISLGFISTLVGIFIALSSGERNLLIIALGTFLGSTIFTLLGLIIAANIISLNQFLVATVPVEIICFLPPISYVFGYNRTYLLLHPGTIIIRLIQGEQSYLLLSVIILGLWISILFLITHRIIKSMFQRVGGVKL